MDNESVNGENIYSDFESKESVLISWTTYIESTKENFWKFFVKKEDIHRSQICDHV